MASTSEREHYVYVAKLAEQAQRYQEMVDAMKKVASLNVELTTEEQDLLSVGYRNVFQARRESLRTLSVILLEEEAKGNDQNVNRIKNYMNKVESELSSICLEVLSLIDEHLLPLCSAGESSVFFCTMKGNYYNYMVEFKIGIERIEATNQAMKAYEEAYTRLAEADLPPTHPIRLELALCFSVFNYETMQSHEKACQLAYKALDEAMSGLDTLTVESFKDTTQIMQLLRDKLSLWNSDTLDIDVSELRIEEV